MMNRARLNRMQRAEFSEMVPNVCFCYCLSMHICYLVLSAHVPQSASSIGASKDLVEPVQVVSVGPMDVAKLRGASLEQNFIVASLSSAIIKSAGLLNSLTAKNFSTWSNLNGVISMNSPAIDKREPEEPPPRTRDRRL